MVLTCVPSRTHTQEGSLCEVGAGSTMQTGLGVAGVSVLTHQSIEPLRTHTLILSASLTAHGENNYDRVISR